MVAKARKVQLTEEAAASLESVARFAEDALAGGTLDYAPSLSDRGDKARKRVEAVGGTGPGYSRVVERRIARLGGKGVFGLSKDAALESRVKGFGGIPAYVLEDAKAFKAVMEGAGFARHGIVKVGGKRDVLYLRVAAHKGDVNLAKSTAGQAKEEWGLEAFNARAEAKKKKEADRQRIEGDRNARMAAKIADAARSVIGMAAVGNAVEIVLKSKSEAARLAEALGPLIKAGKAARLAEALEPLVGAGMAPK